LQCVAWSQICSLSLGVGTPPPVVICLIMMHGSDVLNRVTIVCMVKCFYPGCFVTQPRIQRLVCTTVKLFKEDAACSSIIDDEEEEDQPHDEF